MPIKQKYLSILRIEIDDLIEDIGMIVEQCKRRKESGDITNYVFLENLAVLHKELLGVDNLVKILDDIDPERYAGLDEMIADIEKRIGDRIKSSHLAEALFPLVKRKLEKVARYLDHVQ